MKIEFTKKGIKVGKKKKLPKHILKSNRKKFINTLWMQNEINR